MSRRAAHQRKLFLLPGSLDTPVTAIFSCLVTAGPHGYLPFICHKM